MSYEAWEDGDEDSAIPDWYYEQLTTTLLADGWLDDEQATALKLRNAELEDVVKICRQAIMEIDHAHRNPNWFTDGYSGAQRQAIMWRQRACAAIDAAIQAAPSTGREGE